MSAARRAGAGAGAAIFLATVASVHAQWPPWVSTDEPPASYPAILATPDSVAAGWIVLDARDAAAGRRVPAGALRILPGSLDARHPESGLAAAGLTGEETVVCVSEAKDPVAAARLFWLLEAAGQAHVRFLDGGIDAWTAAGRPLADAPAARAAATRLRPRDDSRRATLQGVLERFGRPDPGRPDFEVLDVRPEEDWEAGHIPHSLSFDVSRVVGADGRFAPPESIRAVVDRLGPRLATTASLTSEFVTVDDGRSGLGALAYLALRIAGVEKVRWLPGGWAEWHASDAPRVRIASAADVHGVLEAAGDGAVVVDTRGPADFLIGHIRGALNIAPPHFADSLAAALERHHPGLDRATAPLVSYCYGPECIRSRNCATAAAHLGFRDILWFRGGMPDWLAAGGEVRGGPGPDPRTD